MNVSSLSYLYSALCLFSQNIREVLKSKLFVDEGTVLLRFYALELQ